VGLDGPRTRSDTGELGSALRAARSPAASPGRRPVIRATPWGAGRRTADAAAAAAADRAPAPAQLRPVPRRQPCVRGLAALGPRGGHAGVAPEPARHRDEGAADRAARAGRTGCACRAPPPSGR